MGQRVSLFFDAAETNKSYACVCPASKIKLIFFTRLFYRTLLPASWLHLVVVSPRFENNRMNMNSVSISIPRAIFR